MAGRPVHTFEVQRTEQLTPHLTRVVLGGGGFDTFTPNDSTDAYVKIVFVGDGTDVDALPQPLTLDSFKGLPPGQQPTVRTYTVRRVDTERRILSKCHSRPVVRARCRRAMGSVSHPRSAGLPDEPQWRLRAGPGGRLAPTRRRRGRGASDQRGTGSVARQRGWQGLHRSRRA